jgi:hypothetical protein
MYESCQELQSIHFYPSQANFLHGSCEHKEDLLDMLPKKISSSATTTAKIHSVLQLEAEKRIRKYWQSCKKYEEEFA